MINKQELDSLPIDAFKSDDELIQKIEHSVLNWYNYFDDNLQNGYEDARFVMGEQWTAFETAEYNIRQKVMLTSNVLYSFIKNIVGEQRQNTPQIQIRSLDNKTNQNQINIFENALRSIAYASSSDIAYQTAFFNALIQGFGAWRIVMDYEPESFNKRLLITPINNPAITYFDRSAQNSTKSDGEYCGIYSKMNEEEFRKTYGIEFPQQLNPPVSNLRYFNWQDNNGITILEHFHKEWEKTKIYKLSNGDVVKAKDLDARMKELKKIHEIYSSRLDSVYLNQLQNGNMVSPPPPLDKIKIVAERIDNIPIIRHFKAIKGEILEKGIFPGRDLPIIYVDGDSNYTNGKQETVSFIRDAKDPQRFINMIMSDLANMAKLGHKGEFLATYGQISDYKAIWDNPEKFNGVKFWKPDELAPGDKPVYIPPAELPQSFISQVTNLFQMIQISLGRFEANRGEEGNEQSGKAIANRAKQGNTSVFVYLDNLNRAIEQTGKICLNIFPEVYKENDFITLTKKDGRSEIFDLQDENNKFLLNKPKLDLVITAGASFEMQKMDAFNQLITILQVLQLPSSMIADLVIENTNLDNTPQLLERIRNFILSPQIKAQEEGKPMPQQPPDPQSILAQQEADARLLEAKAQYMKAMSEYGRIGQDAQVANTKAAAEIGKAKLDYSSKLMEHAAKLHDISFNKKNM